MSDFASWLNSEIRREQGRAPIGPARYATSDFREVRRERGQPRTQRYVNARTGAEVSRRQRDALVGSPLPRGGMTRARAMERIADRMERTGATVGEFEAVKVGAVVKFAIPKL